jgi:2-succinyl-6-hydroxy-2,4-cyclohexadiene-1-carboxylate synthase
VNFVGLHGFWGAPSDFDRMISHLRPDRVWVPNLFEAGKCDPSHAFPEWTENFLKEVSQRFSGPVCLAGYSQGGRLALHALISAPDRFERSLLMSCHPGPLEGAERAARQAWLQTWRVKFLENDWDALVHDWDMQEVFVGDAKSAKPRVAREILVQALENWSILRHGFGWAELRQLPESVIWACGGLDRKYCVVHRNLQQQKVSGRFAVIEQAGHRILSDQPAAAAQLLREDI